MAVHVVDEHRVDLAGHTQRARQARPSAATMGASPAA
jgi:hypothetical protein